MSTCNTHIEPVFQEDPCNGERVSTTCVIHPPAIPPLSLPANSPVSNIISNIVLALSNQNNLITELTETVTELENQGIPEAPIDNQLYGRKDAEWEVVPTNTFTPSDYDLNEFTNESADPFVRVSEVPSGNFIPLTGTEVGSPIIGNLETQTANPTIIGNEYNNIRIGGDYLSSFNGILIKGNDSTSLELGSNYAEFKDGEDLHISFGSGQVGISKPLYINTHLMVAIRGYELFPKGVNPLFYAQLGDIATTNLTATPLTVGTLNSTYPTQPTGFKVICPTINKIYIKSSLTTWQEILTTNVT